MTPRLRTWLTVLCLAAGAVGGATGEESVLQAPHPGRLRARRLALEGTEILHGGQVERAAALLTRAVGLDPLLAGAWANLAAAEVQRCRPTAARGAAAVARRLDPTLEPAARTYRSALDLDCPVEPEASIAAWSWIGTPGQAPEWERAAAYGGIAKPGSWRPSSKNWRWPRAGRTSTAAGDWPATWSGPGCTGRPSPRWGGGRRHRPPGKKPWPPACGRHWAGSCREPGPWPNGRR
ncbi:MAG: hypothetical protein Q9Q13_07360 [Acidobacteriota bacterium]|nr:hypothetical protein [Acidobacteriota bacterium]